MRADLFLAQNGFADSRTKANSLIGEGAVTIDGVLIPKASYEVDEQVEHEVKVINTCPYVSRGGLKLEAALNQFGVDVTDFVAIDIGASTGGFTDCLLAHGSGRVFALDCGTDQLHPKLLNNEKVSPMSQINARYLRPEMFPVKADIVVMDVSFISQTLILPAIADLLKDDGYLISLIKPQFEVGKNGLGKNGIVKDERNRKRAITNVTEAAVMNGFLVKKTILSPIQGGDGNIEYLMLAQKRKG